MMDEEIDLLDLTAGIDLLDSIGFPIYFTDATKACIIDSETGEILHDSYLH